LHSFADAAKAAFGRKVRSSCRALADRYIATLTRQVAKHTAVQHRQLAGSTCIFILIAPQWRLGEPSHGLEYEEEPQRCQIVIFGKSLILIGHFSLCVNRIVDFPT
jgi:hypothetical protein